MGRESMSGITGKVSTKNKESAKGPKGGRKGTRAVASYKLINDSFGKLQVDFSEWTIFL